MNLDQTLVLGSVLLALGYLVFRKMRAKKNGACANDCACPKTEHR